jgi:uncharacterized protein YndB with AHSA1/START domain
MVAAGTPTCRYGLPMNDQTISASTIIDAPPATVFSILADPRQHSRIDGSDTVGSVIDAPDRLGAKGDTFKVHMKLYGVPYTIRNKVVELEPDRRIAWRHFGAHRWRYELEPTDDGGTKVTESFDYSRFGRLGRRVLERLGIPERNRRGIEQTLVRLKQTAESDATAAAS